MMSVRVVRERDILLTIIIPIMKLQIIGLILHLIHAHAVWVQEKEI